MTTKHPGLLLVASLALSCSSNSSPIDMAQTLDAPLPLDLHQEPDRGDLPPAACDPASLVKQVDPLRMLADLKQLTGQGDRYSHQGQTKAAAYLRGELAKHPGLSLTEQSYDHQGLQYVNLVATIEGTTDKDRYALACAHYDATSAISPGADDNASGAAAVLEAARVLAACPGKKTIRLLLLSMAHIPGSTAYVASLKATVPPDRVEGVINVDMVGFGPSTEDLDLVTRPEYQSLVSRVKGAIDKLAPVKTKTFVGNHCG